MHAPCGVIMVGHSTNLKRSKVRTSSSATKSGESANGSSRVTEWEWTLITMAFENDQSTKIVVLISSALFLGLGQTSNLSRVEYI